MKERVLFVATVDSHIGNFHRPFLDLLCRKDYIVDVASNRVDSTKSYNCDNHYNIKFSKRIFSLANIIAFFNLLKIIKKNNYTFIHTHTPISSLLIRIAAYKKTRVIYTAHGLHFFKGNNFIKNFIYYNVEKYLSKFTDLLIVINEEDYNITKEKFNCKVELVDGVGVDLDNFKKMPVKNSSDTIRLSYVAELSKRKNQIFLLKNMKEIKELYPNLELALAGNGKNFKKYQKYIKKNNLDNVRLLGYVKDINKLINESDIVVSSSKQEGLPVNILEAIAISKPLLVSNVRGNRDLVHNNRNGYVFELSNQDFLEKLEMIIKEKGNHQNFDLYNRELTQRFKLETILSRMEVIYEDFTRDK